MTIPSSYTNLIAAVKERIEDDSAEFNSYIPTAIYLAEDRLFKEIDSDEFIVHSSVVNLTGDFLINRPSNYGIPIDTAVRLVTGSVISLDKKTKEFLREYWPVPASTGTPKYYADWSSSQIVVAPAFSAISVTTFSHHQKPTVLGVSNETNVFTSAYPSALYYATLSEMCGFSRNYEMQKEVEAKYLEELQTINNQSRRKRRDRNVVPRNTEPAVNTLKGDN